MATSISIIKVKSHVTSETIESLLDRLKLPLSLRSFGWSRAFEEPNIVIGLFNWDSIKSHYDFTSSPFFPPFQARIEAVCTEPVNMFHTHLQPFPPSLIYKSDVVEFAVLTKKPGVEQDQFEQVSDAFFERVKHAPGYLCHFRGIKYEDSNVCVTFVGWDSMESFDATRSNEALNQLQTLGGLIVEDETYMYHLSLQLK